MQIATAKEKNARSLYILGDSIAKGIVQKGDEGRYQVLHENNLAACLGAWAGEVVNQAHMGYTLARGVAQIERLLQRGVDIDYMLLAYGGNDCDFCWQEVAAKPSAEHQPKTRLADFITLYKQLVKTLRLHKIVPIVLNLPPLHARRYLQHLGQRGFDVDKIQSWLGDIERIYRYQEYYSHAIEMMAMEEKVDLVDLRSAFLQAENFPALLGADGIHPTIEGYHLMAKTILEQLIAMGEKGARLTREKVLIPDLALAR